MCATIHTLKQLEWPRIARTESREQRAEEIEALESLCEEGSDEDK